MAYEKLLVYYSSGTGNTLKVSKWVQECAIKKGMNTALIKIEEADPVNQIKDGAENIIALGAPAHAFTAPWHMIKFVWRFPRSKGTHAFSFSTRGSVKFGRFYLPGGSGSAIFLFAIILFLKGYKVRGGFTIDMPFNWQSFFPPQKPGNTDAVINKAELKVNKFVNQIFSGSTYWISFNNIYEFILGLSLSWFSVLYIYIGRPFMAKVFFASQKCNACGVCVEGCPVGGVSLSGGKGSKPYWTRRCESCMRCMAFCPEKAIEASHSFAVFLCWITFLPVNATFLPYLMEFENQLFGVGSELHIWIIATLLVPLEIYILYYLLYFASKVPFLNTLLKFTSFTPLYRRYNDPDTKLKDLVITRRPK